MTSIKDGPSTDLFSPLPFEGTGAVSRLSGAGISETMSRATEHTPSGACIGWGIPFQIEDVVVLKGKAIAIDLAPTKAQWLVFMHTSDLRTIEPGPGGIISPMRGQGQLARAGDVFPDGGSIDLSGASLQFGLRAYFR